MKATSEDIPDINYILSQDEVFLPSMDDNFPLDKRWNIGRYLIDDPNNIIALPNKRCVIVAYPLGSLTTYQVHIGVDPEGRGKEAVGAAKEAIKWFFDNYPSTHKLVAYIPTTNRLSQVFASLVGMRREGVCMKSFLKDGRLIDQVVYGLSREDN